MAHDLDAVAALPDGTARMFDANGAGVAIGDLDDDGLPDVVLANQRGANTILWPYRDKNMVQWRSNYSSSVACPELIEGSVVILQHNAIT